jgi:hypothetical protein
VFLVAELLRHGVADPVGGTIVNRGRLAASPIPSGGCGLSLTCRRPGRGSRKRRELVLESVIC